MRKDVITAAIGIVVLTLLLGIIYPLFITGVSQVAFPGNANGQKIYVHGKLVGSKIIGQNFADQVVKNGKPQVDKNGNPVTNPDPKYFQSRPSATVPPDNGAASTFSNLGPNSVATEQAIAEQHLGVHRAREALRAGAHSREGASRRGQQLCVGTRSRHLSRRTPISRPTGSRPCGTCRSRGDEAHF